MTILNGSRPATGWSAIVFSHGYTRPSEYRTTARYVAHVDATARNGYVIYKPDLCGPGDGDNHNISTDLAVAMQRTVAVFDRYAKGESE
jgi:hypothetical protein